MTKTFDHLFILGRPAAGKSEFMDFMKKISDAERSERFHIGHFVELDDFVWLWEKFRSGKGVARCLRRALWVW